MGKNCKSNIRKNAQISLIIDIILSSCSLILKRSSFFEFEKVLYSISAMKYKKSLVFSSSKLLLLLTFLSCDGGNDQGQHLVSGASEEIFPKGALGPAANFTGHANDFGLVANDSTYNTLVGNVYFEKNARSNWRIHPSG